MDLSIFKEKQTPQSVDQDILFYYSVMHIKTNTLFPALLLFCQSDSLILQERGTQELPWHRELIKFI